MVEIPTLGEVVTTNLIFEVEVRSAGSLPVERARAFEEYLAEVIDRALPEFFTPAETPELFNSPRLHTREVVVLVEGEGVRTLVENFGKGNWKVM
jgi:hypothetical protein